MMPAKLARKVALMACVLPLCAASGCTGTDVLSTGNAPFAIRVNIVNPSSRHETSFFSVSAIVVRPNGEAADSGLGSAPIQLIAAAAGVLTVNLNDPMDLASNVRLSTGSYRVESIQLSSFAFRDLQAMIPATSCTELERYPAIGTPVTIPGTQLGSPNLTVSAGDASSVTLVIDGAALVDVFEASFPTCNLATGSATASQFRPNLFAAAAPTFITFQ